MAGLYLHFPFCKQACHYCNFYFSTSAKNKPQLIQALKKELQLRRASQSAPLESIYFGGGSPSLLSLSDLEEILTVIRETYALAASPEITLELNPDDGNTAYLKGLKQLGINRLSVGVQSFLDRDLQLMHRVHTARESEEVLGEVAALFENFSVDLIYGNPQSSLKEWQQTMAKALSYNPPHISAYALTVEPKTVLAHRVKNNLVRLLDDEMVQAQYDDLVHTLTNRGFRNYEFSNFAQAGYYAINNSSYWQGKPYMGIGPSAHSYDGAFLRSWNVSNTTKYIQAIEENRLPQETETLTRKDRFNEYIMTGLRTEWGVSLQQVNREFGSQYGEYLEKQAEQQIQAHRLFWDGDILRIPVKARFLSDGIAAELFLVNLV